jgi:hypothetical protein
MPVQEAGGSHMIGQDNDEPDADDFAMSGLSDEDVQAAVEAMHAYKQQQLDAQSAVARDIEGKLTKRMGTRKNKENQWLESMRLYLGSLSSYNIVTGDYPFGTQNDSNSPNSVHRPEFNIIRQKCNIAIAQTVAHQFAAGDKNWNIRTPQVIDLDPQDLQTMQQVMQNPNLSAQDAAEMKTDLMEREIDHHLELTNYAAEARLSIADRVILGTGVMKGPLNQGKLKRTYVKQQTSDGKIIRVPTYAVENTPCIYRVNLWYWFPEDTVTDVSKAEDSIEAHPMSKTELTELLKHPGYKSDQITECLSEEPRQYTNSPFNDPAYLTQGINLLKNKYLVLEYHGPIKKEDLGILGLGDADSPLDEVYGEIWVCNSRVIRMQLSTIEGCNRIPYVACTWEPDPAMIFGFGIPMLARDQQRVVNESYKMVLDNAGVSAGPQVIVDTTLIQPVSGGLEIEPFKVWQSKEYGADMTKAIQFFTPPNSFEELSALITLARGFADEESSINLLAAGAQTPAGAIDSATGLALANENALTPLFYKSEQWDDEITRPLIELIYDWEMQYNPKDEIKGTFDIDVRTTTAYLKGLMDQQKLDKLFQEVSQGSPIAEFINMDDLLQARLSIMKLPFEGIVKNLQQVQQDRKNAPPKPPDPNVIKAQAAMQANQIDAQRLELDKQQLAWDQQKHAADLQQQAAVQHDTNQSKIMSHQLLVEQAALELHAKDKERESAAQVAAIQTGSQVHSAMVNSSTTKQLAGLQHVQHQDKMDLEQRKIASQERQSHEKALVQLKGIRVNAEAKKQNEANRKLDSRNPKPK